MSIKNIFNTQISTHIKERVLFYYLQAMFPLMLFFLAEQNFSLLGGHFGHLSKNILYTRPVQHTHKSVELLTLMCYLHLIWPLM